MQEPLHTTKRKGENVKGKRSKETLFGVPYFDSCLVTLQQLHRLSRVAGIPDGNEVVIATTGKIPPVCSPLQTTDFQLVQSCTTDAVLWLSDIMIVDLSTVATTKSTNNKGGY